MTLPDLQTQERVARNDAVFRDANEQIDQAVEEHGLTDVGQVPFLCECADPRCTQVVRISPRAYRHVRSNPRWFLKVPSHIRAAKGAVAVVEDHGSYVIVEKLGHAGEVAEALAEGSRS